MNKQFGNKLRNLREEHDLTQSELGEKINFSQRKISYLENNVCEPNIDDIKSICLFFKISADSLLGLPKGLNYKE